MRVNWAPVLDRAAEIVQSYDTLVTLRQLYYRLVATQLIPNQQSYYRRLSQLTAQARRDGWFPALIDESRDIHRPYGYRSPAGALRATANFYRRDHTEGQEVSIYLAVEKRGMVNQLDAWLGDLGLPILALGGYASQSYADDTISDVRRQNRPAILLYAGDHDATGFDIFRDFLDRLAAGKTFDTSR